jgi:hypothetical protein
MNVTANSRAESHRRAPRKRKQEIAKGIFEQKAAKATKVFALRHVVSDGPRASLRFG